MGVDSRQSRAVSVTIHYRLRTTSDQAVYIVGVYAHYVAGAYFESKLPI